MAANKPKKQQAYKCILKNGNSKIQTVTAPFILSLVPGQANENIV
jgi:hypothetical protein